MKTLEKKYAKILKQDGYLCMLNQIMHDMVHAKRGEERFEIHKKTWDLIIENMPKEKLPVIIRRDDRPRRERSALSGKTYEVLSEKGMRIINSKA
jgi:hypothetical protein